MDTDKSSTLFRDAIAWTLALTDSCMRLRHMQKSNPKRNTVEMNASHQYTMLVNISMRLSERGIKLHKEQP